MFIRDTLGNLDRNDREILLAFLLQKPRTWIVAHDEYALTADEEHQWLQMASRRESGEPVAYITGTKEFYGRTFAVNSSVLIPRPATEVLVDTAVRVLRGETVENNIDADTDIVIASDIWGNVSGIKLIADIGTGSGCIGITLACECPEFAVIATDISEEAIRIAKENAAHHGVSNRITFLQGDALDPLAFIREPFLIVSNPPYIPSTMKLMKDVQDFEPHAALFSGEEGTDVIKRMMKQATEHPFCVGVIVECRTEHVKYIVLEAGK